MAEVAEDGSITSPQVPFPVHSTTYPVTADPPSEPRRAPGEPHRRRAAHAARRSDRRGGRVGDGVDRSGRRASRVPDRVGCPDAEPVAGPVGAQCDHRGGPGRGWLGEQCAYAALRAHDRVGRDRRAAVRGGRRPRDRGAGSVVAADDPGEHACEQHRTAEAPGDPSGRPQAPPAPLHHGSSWEMAATGAAGGIYSSPGMWTSITGSSSWAPQTNVSAKASLVIRRGPGGPAATNTARGRPPGCRR